MHIFVWGSILIWLVAIPIMSAGGLYGLIDLFLYVGVAFEVLRSASFWFYLLLATAIALAPTIIFRIMRLDVNPHIVDDVRLLQKNEGRRLFKRLKFHRKPPESAVSRRSVKRTGYAFSHTEGYGDMITTGHIFGMNEEEVFAERQRRLSTIISRPTSRGTTPSKDKDSLSAIKATLAIAGADVAAAVTSHGTIQEGDDQGGKEKVSVEVYKTKKELEQGDKIDAGTSSSQEKEKSLELPDEQSSVIEAENVKVDLAEDVSSAGAGDVEQTEDTDEVSSDHESSRALLIPTKKSSNDTEGEAIEMSNLDEEESDNDKPLVSMNLPGSVESPTIGGEERDIEEGNDDHTSLI